MKTSLNVDYNGGMSFESNVGGHKIVIDANEAVGGSNKGPTPKPLMLLSLAGCTGMDVVSILKKMKVQFDNFSIEVEAELTEEHPKHYSSMNVVYKFWGDNLPLEKIEKAVNLSDEKYCGVSAVYKMAIPVTHEIRINPEK